VKIGLYIPLKKTLLMLAKIKTTPIFKKLLVIKIVAKSLFGLLRRSLILLTFLSFLSKLLSISELLREKKAISDPDINAEIMSNITNKKS
tara:strand:+ start:853 stop:1122 length:270 start_codon:yes stop_codon:yes gene_type:complete